MIKKTELQDFMQARESDFPIYALNEFSEIVTDETLPDEEFIRRIVCFFDNNEHYLDSDDALVLNSILNEDN